MDFRNRRQIAVLAVFVFAIMLVGFFTYRAARPVPTCFDSAKNQNEENVDCGGNCISCAFKQQQPIEVFWTRFVKVRENTYDVAAELRNANVRLAAASFEYEFRLYDTAGVLVATRRGTNYMYPGEAVHLVEVGLTSGRVIENAEIVIRNTQFALSDRIEPDVVAGNREYAIEQDASGANQSVVKALVVNRTLEDIRAIEISTLVFDDNVNLVAVNRTILDAISAGETKPVKFTWPSQFPQSISSVLIEVRSRENLPAPAP